METAPPIRVLHLEDDPRDAEIIRHQLLEGGLAAEIVQVSRREDFQAALGRGEFDIVLCDYNIPGYDGLAALQLVRATDPFTPVMLISGSLREEEAVKSLQLGATDYLIKERLSRLVPAVQRALVEAETQRRQQRAEAALRASEERFRLIVENSGDLMCEVALDGRLTYLSPNTRTQLGYEPAELLGRDVFEHVHPDDLAEARATFGQPEVRMQCRYRHRSGEYRWFEINARLFHTASGEQRVAAIGRDVTERRVLEEQFRQAQKMESIGQLAGGVAHDFNNILTVITGQASLILGDESTLSAEVRGGISEIADAALRGASLTRQLLTFSRKQVMQPRDLDLNTIVQDMTRMLGRTLGDDIALTVDLAPNLPFIRGDQGMMEQILLNLAVNARDAMPTGGGLIISTTALTLDAAQVQGHADARPGRSVCLGIADSGCGIPAENLTHIFEPFFTTKEVGKGTGLGLASVHGIVKQHHGWVRVKSHLGRGTTFQIYFPVAPVGSAPAAEKSVIPKLEGGRETILLVDDEPSVRFVVGRILKKLGYEVVEASSGVEAIELMETAERRIDLLLTDMVMPGGVTGQDLAGRLRESRPGLRVLYASGYSVDLAAVTTPPGEKLHFLEKPYSPQQLASAVRDCLEQ